MCWLWSWQSPNSAAIIRPHIKCDHWCQRYTICTWHSYNMAAINHRDSFGFNWHWQITGRILSFPCTDHLVGKMMKLSIILIDIWYGYRWWTTSLYIFKNKFFHVFKWNKYKISLILWYLVKFMLKMNSIMLCVKCG